MALQKQGEMGGVQVVYTPGFGFIFASVVGLTAGTMFLMWLGEQITERGIGNGISLLIFAGIVSGLPGAVMHTLSMAQNGELSVLKVLLVIAVIVVVTAFVVYMERAQRRITVNYARRQGGPRAYQNQTSHLPLKINMSGVIPPIFATSLIMFPATAATWFSSASQMHWLQMLTTALTPGEPSYEIIFAVLIILFAFFYTAIVFNSPETADNLKRSGALIPGIRPGKATADYIDGVLTRLTGAGALYLVAGMPGADFLADSLARAVLFRRDLAADRGRRGDGLHCAGAGASGQPPVRKPAEEGQPAAQLRPQADTGGGRCDAPRPFLFQPI